MIFVDVDATQSLQMTIAAEAQLSPMGMHAFLSKVAQPRLVERIDRRFTQEGDDATGKWEQLARNTAGIRKSKGFPPWHPINKRTGALHSMLRSSYRVTTGRGNTLTIPDRPRGNLESKLRVAQMGGYPSRGGGKTQGPSRPAPARPVLGLSQVDQTLIEFDLFNWIKIGARP